ncbi:hypothetical protein AT01_3403 [Yersinia aldovae 670-83]|nr:hypothetical protein AT01_3403 [Yersinia aldovae 670-83]
MFLNYFLLNVIVKYQVKGFLPCISEEEKNQLY